MPQIETLTELLGRLGSVVTSPDSLTALADQGFTLSPAIGSGSRRRPRPASLSARAA